MVSVRRADLVYDGKTETELSVRSLLIRLEDFADSVLIDQRTVVDDAKLTRLQRDADIAYRIAQSVIDQILNDNAPRFLFAMEIYRIIGFTDKADFRTNDLQGEDCLVDDFTHLQIVPGFLTVEKISHLVQNDQAAYLLFQTVGMFNNNIDGFLQCFVWIDAILYCFTVRADRGNRSFQIMLDVLNHLFLFPVLFRQLAFHFLQGIGNRADFIVSADVQLRAGIILTDLVNICLDLIQRQDQ